jgi:hypothetical protein
VREAVGVSCVWGEARGGKEAGSKPAPAQLRAVARTQDACARAPMQLCLPPTCSRHARGAPHGASHGASWRPMPSGATCHGAPCHHGAPCQSHHARLLGVRPRILAGNAPNVVAPGLKLLPALGADAELGAMPTLLSAAANVRWCCNSAMGRSGHRGVKAYGEAPPPSPTHTPARARPCPHTRTHAHHKP